MTATLYDQLKPQKMASNADAHLIDHQLVPYVIYSKTNFDFFRSWKLAAAGIPLARLKKRHKELMSRRQT